MYTLGFEMHCNLVTYEQNNDREIKTNQNEENSGHVAQRKFVPRFLNFDLFAFGGVVPPLLLQIGLEREVGKS